MKQQLFIIILLLIIFSCKQERHPKPLDNDAMFKKATSLLYKENDSAFFYFTQVVADPTDSLKTAKAYNYMAIIQADAGDYYGSIESAIASLKFLNEGKKEAYDCLSSNYNELGLDNINLENYDEAIKYFDLAIKYSDNDRYKLVLMNNKALAYRAKKDFFTAIQIYNIVVPKSKANKKSYAQALTNLAITKWLHDSTYNAAPELMKALYIHEQEKDQWGQNSSYNHLANFFTSRRPALALTFTHKRYAMAKQLNSAHDQLGALKKLIQLGPADSIRQYFEDYRQLNDSVQQARNVAKNQFALIRYEVERNKADYLKLQKENAEKAYQITKQRIIMVVVILAALMLSLAAFIWYRKRKQRLALEAENAIRESQLKTSKRVHDVVANGIYQVMTEIENLPDVNKDSILDRLDGLYGKSRDISYETDKYSIKQQNFKDKISHMLQSYGTQFTKISIVGNEQSLWEHLNEQAKYEIEHILQELMINMKKHSQASHVAVRFEQEREQTHIYYTDNGIGMPENFLPNNGLRNTENRIKSIDGEINFDTKVEKGLKIRISFPVS